MGWAWGWDLQQVQQQPKDTGDPGWSWGQSSALDPGEGLWRAEHIGLVGPGWVKVWVSMKPVPLVFAGMGIPSWPGGVLRGALPHPVAGSYNISASSPHGFPRNWCPLRDTGLAGCVSTPRTEPVHGCPQILTSVKSGGQAIDGEAWPLSRLPSLVFGTASRVQDMRTCFLGQGPKVVAC